MAAVRRLPLPLGRRVQGAAAWLRGARSPRASPHVLAPPLPCPQDFCIECPATGSLFSLRDGSIVSWWVWTRCWRRCLGPAAATLGSSARVSPPAPHTPTHLPRCLQVPQQPGPARAPVTGSVPQDGTVPHQAGAGALAAAAWQQQPGPRRAGGRRPGRDARACASSQPPARPPGHLTDTRCYTPARRMPFTWMWPPLAWAASSPASTAAARAPPWRTTMSSPCRWAPACCAAAGPLGAVATAACCGCSML